MSARHVLSNLRETARRHGFAAAVGSAWAALRPHTLRVHLFGLTLPASTAPPEGPGLEFRFATPKEVAAGVPEGRWSARDVEALQHGDRCLLQYRHGTLAGYTWTARSPLAFVTQGVHLSLPDDVAYVYRAFTDPAFRGVGFQSMRSLELLRRLQPEGKRRLFCFVEATNHNSLRGIRKSGYERVGSITIRQRRGVVSVRLRVSSGYWSELRRA